MCSACVYLDFLLCVHVCVFVRVHISAAHFGICEIDGSASKKTFPSDHE